MPNELLLDSKNDHKKNNENYLCKLYYNKKSISIPHNETLSKEYFIPKQVWIAIRNNSDKLPNHYLGNKGFIARNSDWTINFCDNTDKDHFMEYHFPNTSLLWAYQILNPLIGKQEIVLYQKKNIFLNKKYFSHPQALLKLRSGGWPYSTYTAACIWTTTRISLPIYPP
jgi:hypothetical protein